MYSPNRLKELAERPKSEWLSIGWQLNRWDWPNEMSDCKPQGWDEAGMDIKHVYIRAMVNAINAQFSERDILHYHNVVRGRMTQEEFDYWQVHGWEAYYNKFRKLNEAA
jgi:hypothetical protein